MYKKSFNFKIKIIVNKKRSRLSGRPLHNNLLNFYLLKNSDKSSIKLSIFSIIRSTSKRLLSTEKTRNSDNIPAQKTRNIEKKKIKKLFFKEIPPYRCVYIIN